MTYLKSMGGIEVALIFLFTFDFRMILNADVYVTLKSYNIFLFGYKRGHLDVSILLSPLSLLSIPPPRKMYQFLPKVSVFASWHVSSY